MSLFDLSDVILDLASGTYTVTRSTPATYGTDGRLEPGTQLTFPITASVQPLSGRDLLRLPDGLRTRELLKVFSPTQLFVQGAGQDPDQISLQGVLYQVQTAEQWGDGGNFWLMIIAKRGRAAP